MGKVFDWKNNINKYELEEELTDTFMPGAFTLILKKSDQIPDSISDIKKELLDKVSVMIDGGDSDIGLESTVVKVI